MSRYILAFDTATEAIAVGIARTGGGTEEPLEVLVTRDTVVPRASLSLLLPSVRDTLDEAEVELAAIDLIAVGCGPGSYTGVRIGLSAAKGLAQGLGVPLLGVGTLDAVAWGLAGAQGLVGVIGDAMRKEVYPALFESRDGDVQRLSADEVADPSVVAERWVQELEGPILLAGDGLAKHARLFADALGRRATLADPDLWLPSARGVLNAAMAIGLEAGEPAGHVLPVYTRLSDAEHAEHGRGDSVPRSGVGGPVEGGE